MLPQIYLIIFLVHKRKLSTSELYPDLPPAKRPSGTESAESPRLMKEMAHIGKQQTHLLAHPYSEQGYFPFSRFIFGKPEPSPPHGKCLSVPTSFGQRPQASAPLFFKGPDHQTSASSRVSGPSAPPPDKHLLAPASFGGSAFQPSSEKFDQGPSTIPSLGEPAPRLSCSPSYGEFGQQPSALSSSGGPAPRLSPPPSSKESDQGPSTIPSFAEPAPRLSPPLSLGPAGHRSFGENHRPLAPTLRIFNGNASCLTTTRSFAEVKHASLELIAQRRMIFHHLRLSAALKAFQSDTWLNRQQWWMQNLKFELV